MRCNTCNKDIPTSHWFYNEGRYWHVGSPSCVREHLQSPDRFMPEQTQTPRSVLEDLLDGIRELWQYKGADYTRGSEDRLANFRRNAESLGLDMRQVWAVYASKHWDAIMTWVKNGQVESEPIEGRLYDIATYALLGILIAREQNK